MKSLALSIALVCLAVGPLSIAAQAGTPGRPTEARVIDSFSQLGVDTATPHFGWVVNDGGRAEIQTAYQIRVVLKNGRPTAAAQKVWDSGKITSDQQYGIAYGGKPLKPTSTYSWKVRTWNREGERSPWSVPKRFVTGFFVASDWDPQCLWIQYPEKKPSNDSPAPIFRKAFLVSKPVRSAYLYISGLGQFVAFLNGRKVGDHVVDPAWTDYQKTVDYVTFDVTSQLREGGNALGVMLGNGWLTGRDKMKLRDFGPMRLRAELHIDYVDGSSLNVITDPSWKASRGPYTSVEVHGEETYDARLEQPGWSTAHFADSTWVSAADSSAISGTMVSQNAPPVITHGAFSAVKITNPVENIYVYDFGQNMNGAYQITVKGPAGALVEMLPGEALLHGRAVPSNTHGSSYILKGGGPETWRLTFSTIGFRYLEIRNVTRGAAPSNLPHLLDAKAFFTYTASQQTGQFESSDDRYNKIHMLALNTVRSELVSIHQDGPNYEKLGWQEVAWTMFPSSIYEFDLQQLYTKITRDIRDNQRASGMVATLVPNWFRSASYTGTEGPFQESPAWGSSIFEVPWLIYWNYGDRQVLHDNYEAMKRYLAFMKGKEKNGLITYGLGDWMAPGGSSVPNVEGAVYVLDTRITRNVATVLGQDSDAEYYAREYARVSTTYNKAYFDDAAGLYRPISEANEALPLVFGIVPHGREAAVRKALVDDIAHPQEVGRQDSYGHPGEFGPVLPFHVTTGDIGTTFLWRALGDGGDADLVQKMIMQSTAPSYMDMIERGETTIDENWNVAKTRSHDHDMYGGILEWFYRTLGGISALQPSYEVIQLRPEMPDGLKSVTTSYDSVRGKIVSSWSVLNGVTTWTVQVPANTSAELFIPVRSTRPTNLTIKEGSTVVYQDGKPTQLVPGVAFENAEQTSKSNTVLWKIGSGRYHFTWAASRAN